jgi:carbon storage regulator
MLVLTRKTNESIRIGDEIRVTVLEVRGNRVRIGIDAPQDVQIARAEVWVPLAGEMLAHERFAGQFA